MKKFISILLVAMLVIGMFPATALTAFAADTEIVFEFGANSSASHKDGSSSKTTYSETNGNYTLSLTDGANMYPSSYDAKGNSCIKLGTSSKTGTFSLTVPADVTSVVIAVAKYKANATKVKVNGTDYTLTKNSNDGVYDAITVDTSSTKTVSLTTVSGGVRAMVNSITFVVGGSTTPDPEPECTHEGYETYEGTDGQAATCTEDGKTATVYCSNCNEEVTPSSVITATGHNYVDGECERCGDPEPSAPEIPTDGYYKQVTSADEVLLGGKYVIVAADGDNNYAMNLATASGKIDATAVTVVGDSIVSDDISTLPGWVVVPVTDGIALQNGNVYLSYGTSGTDFSTSADPYTWIVETGIHINATTGSNRGILYRISSKVFGGYSTGNATQTDYVYDLKMYKLVEGEAEVVNSTLTFVEQGVTTKTETAEATKSYTMPAAANAAPEGYTFAGWVEAQVQETAIAPETVYAAGDSYTVGNDATFYALYTRTEVQTGSSITAYIAKDISEINDGDVVVITMTKGGTVYALPNNGGASAPAANVIVTENADGQLVADFENILWDLDKDGDNLIFYVHGSTEDWLYCLADNNNGVRVGDGDAKTFVVDAATGYLMNTQTDDPRHIGVYNTQDWRCYKSSNGNVGTNIANQTLTFYVETSISGTVVSTYYTTCVDHSYASGEDDTVVCSYCGMTKTAAASVNGVNYETIGQAIANRGENTVKLHAAVETAIGVTGDLYLDLNGFSVSSLTVTDGTLYGSDSKANTYRASGAAVTVTGEVETDYTANGKRYIALKEGESGYSFHVLEMKLSAVSLRTSQAGIYYKATVSCDPVLAAAASQYGIALSTRNMPGADFATEKDTNGDVNGWTVSTEALVSGEEFTSGSVFGIFKEGLTNNAARGEVKIYANAYLVVDGTVIMADSTDGDKYDAEGFNGIAWSLKDVMVTLNEKFTTLEADDQTRVAQFYKDWTDAMSTWELTAIADAAANLTA